MLVPRRDDLASALERGMARGEVRADLDVSAAAHAVFGSFIHHYLAGGSSRFAGRLDATAATAQD